jgi:hypothetical protein
MGLDAVVLVVVVAVCAVVGAVVVPPPSPALFLSLLPRNGQLSRTLPHFISES